MGGLKINKVFTKDKDPFESFTFVKRSSVIRNTDGSIVFELNDIEVPDFWSQVSTDILAQKYFRKTKVPKKDENGKQIKDKDGNYIFGSENSIKQITTRLAGCWRWWGEKYNYFNTKEDAQNFEDELKYILTAQMAAPNSPQWFNTGLNWAYGLTGEAQGHYYADPETGEVKKSKDAYTHPQPHACFIQNVSDDLVNPGGILDLAVREARLFKYGSGTGSNFSNLRGKGEKLSGGGTSSGLMSFLKIFDSAAGAIKSGGTTRRAAKMVILNVDHPEIEEFINLKMREEQKVADLVAGSKICNKYLNKIMIVAKEEGTDLKSNKLKHLIKEAKDLGVSSNYIYRVLQLVDQGFTSIDLKEFDTYFESEAYETVNGQNANYSVRITNDFFKAVEDDDYWNLIARTDGSVMKRVKARDLWDKICIAAWNSADPGTQYDTTINEWHTCPEDGRINGSNPCSEYMFLDDTACNLASLNLVKFYDEETGKFKVEDFKHAVRLLTIVLEISVLMAQMPSKEVAKKTYLFRTLGLGYANIGSLLMRMGLPYDDDKARAIGGSITAIMTGQAYYTSAEMAGVLGPFDRFEKNKKHMLRVLKNHRNAVYDTGVYDGLTITPQALNQELCPEYLLESAHKIWDDVIRIGEKNGYRNAQVTVLAPTGTIGLLMDCDTTGIEPDFALVKFKKLVGGGYFKIVNQSVPVSLRKLGYSEDQINDIEKYIIGHGSLKDCPVINRESLMKNGFSKKIINSIEDQLKNAFDISFAFNKYIIGEEFCKKMGFGKNILEDLGFSKEDIIRANDYICGTMTIEGAPHIKDEHLPVFDCANKCGKKGKRFISYKGHIKMMASVQPFLSGAISKTVNMPNDAKIKDISDAYMLSWKLMVKANALYRDGSKLSQPLNTVIDIMDDVDGIDNVDEVADSDSVNVRFGDGSVGGITTGTHNSVLIKDEVLSKGLSRSIRRKLPLRRHGIIQEASIAGHKLYFKTGEYEDGTLGELFIDMYKEGASYRSLLNCFAIAVSKGLQYGVPLNEFVDSFIFTRFEPAGPVFGHDAIKNSTSILDFIFRALAYEYEGRDDLVHIKPAEKQTRLIEIKQEETARLNAIHGSVSDTSSSKLIINDVSNNRESFVDNSSIDNSSIDNSSINNSSIDNSSINNSSDNVFDKESSDDEFSDTKLSDHKNSDNKVSDDEVKRAIEQGYTGEQCSSCGSMKVRRNGTCTVCDDCGSTSGCS